MAAILQGAQRPSDYKRGYSWVRVGQQLNCRRPDLCCSNRGKSLNALHTRSTMGCVFLFRHKCSCALARSPTNDSWQAGRAVSSSRNALHFFGAAEPATAWAGARTERQAMPPCAVPPDAKSQSKPCWRFDQHRWPAPTALGPLPRASQARIQGHTPNPGSGIATPPGTRNKKSVGVGPGGN